MEKEGNILQHWIHKAAEWFDICAEYEESARHYHARQSPDEFQWKPIDVSVERQAEGGKRSGGAAAPGTPLTNSGTRSRVPLPEREGTSHPSSAKAQREQEPLSSNRDEKGSLGWVQLYSPVGR